MKRTVRHTDESYRQENGYYAVAEITEGEAGWTRTIIAFDTLGAAEIAALKWNDDHGITEDDVMNVRISSMWASNK